MDELYTELLERGRELLGEQVDGTLHTITIDHNFDISSLSALIGQGFLMLPPMAAAESCKAVTEVVFYLGYLAGKEEGNLELWEDQL